MSLFRIILERVPFGHDELIALIATAPRRYKVYQIPKRDGKTFRTIAQPAPEVKLLQRIVLDKFVSKWPIHHAATAYISEKSIADHARLHVDSRYLLKIDFKDFFPSISADDIRKHAIRHSTLRGTDLDAFINIVAWRNKFTGRFGLSIGAPSSPMISNSLMFEFDTKMNDFCNSQQVTYSRYADDIAFSTNQRDVLQKVKEELLRVLSEIESPKLLINQKKTVNVSKRHSRTLVGLTLTPDLKVSLGRDKKRDIRAKLHLFAKGYLKNEAVTHLRGLLAYAWAIEPEFVISLAEKQGNELFVKLELPFRSRPSHKPNSMTHSGN